MNQADCTAIIAVKNGVNFLAEAVASVRAQTSQLSKILVVDDHSEDETVSLCRDLDIECIPSNGNGQAAALNMGIKKSETEYIAFLDHDDWWDSEKTKLQIEFLKANPLSFGVYSRVTNVYSDGSPQVIFPASRAFGSSILRRNIFEEVGYIDESPTNVIVIGWWAEVAKSKIQVDSLDVPALFRRIHSDNFGVVNKVLAEDNLMRILRAKIQSGKET